jgi:hypothetical protein
MRYLVLVLFCLMGFVGCQYVNPFTPIVQIGIYWIEGEAHKYYDTDDKTMQTAVKAVLKELTLPVIHEQQYEDYYYILAGDQNKFKIKIRPVREKVTKLSIRVDTFGDKPYAELIYRHVDKQPGVQQFTALSQLNAAMDTRPRR